MAYSQNDLLVTTEGNIWERMAMFGSLDQPVEAYSYLASHEGVFRGGMINKLP